MTLRLVGLSAHARYARFAQVPLDEPLNHGGFGTEYVPWVSTTSRGEANVPTGAAESLKIVKPLVGDVNSPTHVCAASSVLGLRASGLVLATVDGLLRSESRSRPWLRKSRSPRRWERTGATTITDRKSRCTTKSGEEKILSLSLPLGNAVIKKKIDRHGSFIADECDRIFNI